jgi:hypothetical protein
MFTARHAAAMLSSCPRVLYRCFAPWLRRVEFNRVGWFGEILLVLDSKGRSNFQHKGISI